jgi:hypothetical protein
MPSNKVGTTKGSRRGRRGGTARQHQAKRVLSQQRSETAEGRGLPVDQPLEFETRPMPLKKFEGWHFLNYLGFLVLFLIVTVSRDSDVYHFGQAVKTAVSVDDFSRIDSVANYYRWLGYHFLPGLSSASFRRSSDTPFALVGLPRVRQLRAAPCSDEGAPDHVKAAVSTCWSSEGYSQETFGRGTQYVHQSEESTEDSAYYSYEGSVQYPGSGFLLPTEQLQRLLRAVPTVESPGDEFYTFPHATTNVSELVDSGWIDGQTTAIFHDFTFVVSGQQMYCNVRMLFEQVRTLSIDWGGFMH